MVKNYFNKVLLLLLAAQFSFSTHLSKTQSSTLELYKLKYSKSTLIPENVKIGELKYSKFPMISENFVYCSAVIFDYQDGAFLAHALPLDDDTTNPFNIDTSKQVTLGNVVDKLMNASIKKGENPENAKIIINAGSKLALDRILEDLKNKGLNNITSSDYEQEEHIRTVFYDPRSNSINIKYQKHFNIKYF